MPIRSATPKCIHCALSLSQPPPIPERARGRASSGGSPGQGRADVVSAEPDAPAGLLCLGCRREQRGEEQEQSKGQQGNQPSKRAAHLRAPANVAMDEANASGLATSSVAMGGRLLLPVAKAEADGQGCNGEEDDQQSGGKQRGRGRAGGTGLIEGLSSLSSTCCRSLVNSSLSLSGSGRPRPL